ncbi:MAG: polysaccharide lyase, partial [Myxococcales bacterium]
MKLSSALLALVVTAPLTADAKVLFTGDFETGDLSQYDRAQIVSADRATVVDSPVTQGRKALRVLVRHGDDPINASGNRNELVKKTLEPVGSERWYRWFVMWPAGYPSVDTWQLFTQWHHTGNSGSPPVEFYVRGEQVRLSVGATIPWRAPLVRGRWHEFVFHVKWSPDPRVGFVELWYDGEPVLPKTYVATQFSGQLNYLKLGLYRNDTVTADGIVFHDGFVMGESLQDVKPELFVPPAPTGDDPAPVQPPPAAPSPQPSEDPLAGPADPTAEGEDDVGPLENGPRGCASAPGAALPLFALLPLLQLLRGP